MTVLFLVLAAQLFLVGTNAVAPFRLAVAEPEPRRAWSLAVLPLLLASLLLGVVHVGLRPDAALAWGLAWPPQTIAARFVLVVAAAGALGGLVTALGGRGFEPAAWRAAGLLALFLLAGASFAGELLRTGGGPEAPRSALLLAAAARAVWALAAGEVATGRPRWLVGLAAALGPIAFYVAPAALRFALAPDRLTLVAASILLAASPFLPPAFRRPAAIAGVLLAALFLARAEAASASLELRGYGSVGGATSVQR